MNRSLFFLAVSFFLAGTQLFALDFGTVSSQIDSTYNVKIALLEVARLEKEIMALKNPEDYSVSMNPAVKSTSLEDGDFGEEVEISGMVSLKVPLGLSDLENERLSFAEDSLKNAEAAVVTAREEMFIKLYDLYQNAWLLQEEEPVLAMELKAAESYSEILQQRFKAGTISLITLASGEETLQDRTDDYSQNLLKQRLAWYELMFNANLDIEPEHMEQNILNLSELPKPRELSSWLEDNHPLLEGERIKMAQLEETIQRIKKADIDISITPFFNYDGHSASVSYSFSDPEITSSYSFPVYTFGEISSGSSTSTSTWNTGVSVNISLGSNRSDKLDAEALKLSLKSSEARYEYLIESVNLELRSAYQQFIRNQGVYEQKKSNLARTKENHKIMETKRDLGQASDFELLESKSLVARSEWEIESARIISELSWLKVIENAVWFEKSGIGF